MGKFYINKYEVTILEFKSYADKNKFISFAEINGGGYEWEAGWEKRENWNYFPSCGVK